MPTFLGNLKNLGIEKLGIIDEVVHQTTHLVCFVI